MTRQTVHAKYARPQEERRQQPGPRRRWVVDARAFDAWARAEAERDAVRYFERVRGRQGES